MDKKFLSFAVYIFITPEIYWESIHPFIIFFLFHTKTTSSIFDIFPIKIEAVQNSC